MRIAPALWVSVERSRLVVEKRCEPVATQPRSSYSDLGAVRASGPAPAYIHFMILVQQEPMAKQPHTMTSVVRQRGHTDAETTTIIALRACSWAHACLRACVFVVTCVCVCPRMCVSVCAPVLNCKQTLSNQNIVPAPLHGAAAPLWNFRALSMATWCHRLRCVF